MHSLVPTPVLLTPEEYFAWEARQDVPHEYADGEVFPMPGGTFAHFTLIAAWVQVLRNSLADRDAHVLPDGMRLQIRDQRFVYPDVQVVMGTPEFRDERTTTLTNPALIIEVLSDSTAAYDRGEKFAIYRDVPSVQEVIFADPEKMWVEVARRTGSSWTIEQAVTEGEITLDSIGVNVPLSDLYRGLNI